MYFNLLSHIIPTSIEAFFIWDKKLLYPVAIKIFPLIWQLLIHASFEVSVAIQVIKLFPAKWCDEI